MSARPALSRFDSMHADSPAKWLILAGFLLNAGAWPLSAWLPDAYPEASWSGTVFLSAFTTKTAVYVLLRGFPGEEILIWLGLFMVFYGIVYAILENDMRRILAYSIVNQVGFMVTGIGIGTTMALNGAAAHAFVHIIYKALLLMSAGSVLLMTGRAQMQRARRPLPHHAGHHGLRHHRRAVDLGVPAHLGIRRQIDDLRRSGGRPASDDRLVPARGRLRRRLPPCRHQVPLVRLLPEGLGARPARSTLEHAAGDDPAVRVLASALGFFPGVSTRCCRIRSISSPTRRATWSRSSSCCSSPALPSSCCSAG